MSEKHNYHPFTKKFSSCCRLDFSYMKNKITAMGIRKSYDGNFIFTLAIVKVRYGDITTAKILKHGNYLK